MESQLEQVAVARLRPHPRNARTHSKKQLRMIAKSIERFGFLAPVLIDGDDVILAGHARVEAAKLLGRETVPCRRVAHLSPEDQRAYLLADNQLALKAGWDRDVLAIELQEFVDLGMDMTVIGFEPAEIDAALEAHGEAHGKDASRDDETPAAKTVAVTQLGDMWLLGSHLILCGDARDAGAYLKLMGDERAELVFTDPPYNVPIHGFVGGKGKIKHGEFAMASGEMSKTAFTHFLRDTLGLAAAHSNGGAIHFVCMDWRHIDELSAASTDIYSELKNLIVWVKDNGGMGTFYRSRHELIFAYKVGTAAHVNTFELGQFGRHRTNVWEYAGVNSMRADRLDELAMHPTVKPCALVADALKDASRPGAIVLDPFSGSGTTLIAAERTGRRARVIELDPVYVDVAVRRWQTLTGRSALSANGDARFDEVEALFGAPVEACA
ncbi:MAG: site-specific DNA-methyltransferase [Terricaulis sp.]